MEPRRAHPDRAGPVSRNNNRARHWLRASAAICLAATAISGAASSAAEAGTARPTIHHRAAGAAVLQADAGPRAQATPDQDTLTVNPPAVPASSTHDFTFTYESVKPIAGPLIITLVVPAGWTPPAPSIRTAGPGSVSVACPACRDPKTGLTPVIKPEVTRRQITVSAPIREPDEPALTITYAQAQAPASAGPATFDATEQPPHAKPAALTSPTVTVTCADGAGRVDVSPGRTTVGSISTLVFTYAAGGCAIAGGVVSLTARPAGPSLRSSRARPDTPMPALVHCPSPVPR